MCAQGGVDFLEAIVNPRGLNLFFESASKFSQHPPPAPFGTHEGMLTHHWIFATCSFLIFVEAGQDRVVLDGHRCNLVLNIYCRQKYKCLFFLGDANTNFSLPFYMANSCATPVIRVCVLGVLH